MVAQRCREETSLLNGLTSEVNHKMNAKANSSVLHVFPSWGFTLNMLCRLQARPASESAPLSVLHATRKLARLLHSNTIKQVGWPFYLWPLAILWLPQHQSQAGNSACRWQWPARLILLYAIFSVDYADVNPHSNVTLSYKGPMESFHSLNFPLPKLCSLYSPSVRFHDYQRCFCGEESPGVLVHLARSMYCIRLRFSNLCFSNMISRLFSSEVSVRGPLAFGR